MKHPESRNKHRRLLGLILALALLLAAGCGDAGGTDVPGCDQPGSKCPTSNTDTGGSKDENDRSDPISVDNKTAECDGQFCPNTTGKPRCNWTPRSCLHISYSDDCAAQSGCYWSKTNGDCRGVATPCEQFTTFEECDGQRGCNWY